MQYRVTHGVIREENHMVGAVAVVLVGALIGMLLALMLLPVLVSLMPNQANVTTETTSL